MDELFLIKKKKTIREKLLDLISIPCGGYKISSYQDPDEYDCKYEI